MSKKSKQTAKADWKSPNDRAQPIYAEIHEAIKGLSNKDAIEVLECVAAQCEGQIEGMEQELAEE